jgi:PAS domain S-box-containing protein
MVGQVHDASRLALAKNRIVPLVQSVALVGGGQMGDLVREFDWTATPLGPIDCWPRSLLDAVNICLSASTPIVLWLGHDLRVIYNDACIPLYARSHQDQLGKSDAGIASVEAVLRGEDVRVEHDRLLLLDRNGCLEEAYFTYSYSAIRDDAGNVNGVFGVPNEITDGVLGARRLRVLHELAQQVAAPGNRDDACAVIADILARHPADVPLALIYLFDSDGRTARLAAAAGFHPTQSSLEAQPLEAESVLFLQRALAAGETVILDDEVSQLGPLLGGGWPKLPNTCLVMLLRAEPSPSRPFGALVAGISPHRRLDDAYRAFLDLLAHHVTTAIANAGVSPADGPLHQDTPQEQFMAMVDAAPIMIWQSGSDGLITYVNKGWLDFRGRPIEQEVGLGWAAGVHADERAGCLRTYVAAIDAHCNFEMEYRLRRHDGEYRWIVNRGTPVHGANGSFQGYIGGCIDITEHKQAAAERAREIVELQDQALQTFFVISMAASAALADLPSEPVASALAQIGELALAGTDSLRDAVFALNHSEVSGRGVVAAMGRLVSRFQRRTGIDAELIASGPPDRLSTDAAEMLYAVVGQALSNVERHSTASAVVVGLRVSPQSVTLTVHDDSGGASRPPGAMRIAGCATEFGLRGVGQRVRNVGGTFIAHRGRDGGFVVRVRLPLNSSRRMGRHRAPP